jgi:hypothetical protein
VAVGVPRAPALDLRQPPRPLGVDHPRGTLELDQTLTQLAVKRDREDLPAQFVEGGSQRTHASTL